MTRVNRIKQVASSIVSHTKPICSQKRFLHRDHVHRHHLLCGCAQGARLFLLQQRHQELSNESNNQKRFIQKVNQQQEQQQQQQAPVVGDYAFEIHANQIKFGMQYGIELCVCDPEY
jgi:hypothetical protein